MLQSLYIKNIALIDEANIEFGSGLNILSGETGSGKSVVLDCINFVLGSKADKSLIRSGESEAFVRAEFFVELDSYAAVQLKEYDIDTDGEIVISRKFSLEGKSSTKINGVSVTATMLKSVTQHLVDVHGQSEHFYMLGEDNQLKVIDDLCGAERDDVRTKLGGLIDEKRELKKQIAKLGGNETERERMLDMLAYQINEIESADIRVGELEELETRRNLLMNAEKISNALSAVRTSLSDDGGAVDALSHAARQLSNVSNVSPEYAELLTRLEEICSEAQDIAYTASDMGDELTFDEHESERVNERISQIKALFKKYGDGEDKVLEFLEKATQQKDLLSEGAEAVEKYNKRIDELDDEIFALCMDFTGIRKKHADELCGNIENELKSLNIPDARVDVEFKPYDRNSANLDSKNGSDVICFMFSANKGEPLKPLSKIISGGEMSRFMLALKLQLGYDSKAVSTYIFDEIDSGISGYTAMTVAEKFVEIAKKTQVLAVSHLPQVGAASDDHYLIYKTEQDGKTVTRIKKLTLDEKVEEIVRLTGSVTSDAAETHARELIARFDKG